MPDYTQQVLDLILSPRSKEPAVSKPTRNPAQPNHIPVPVDSGIVMVEVAPAVADEFYGPEQPAQSTDPMDQEDQQAREDLAIVRAVIARQEESLSLAAANAAPDAMGKDGLEDDRKVIAALKRAAAALGVSLDQA